MIPIEDVIKEIRMEEFIRPKGGTMTICVLTMKNGFQVIGESACVDPKDFDEKIGRQIAYDRAFGEVWKLVGFKTMEKAQ